MIASPFVGDDYETDYWLLAARPAMEKLAATGENMTVTTNYSCTTVFNSALNTAPSKLRDKVTFTWKLSEADVVLVWTAYHRAEEGYSMGELQASADWLDVNDLVAPGWNENGEFEEWFTIDACGVEVLKAYRRVG